MKDVQASYVALKEVQREIRKLERLEFETKEAFEALCEVESGIELGMSFPFGSETYTAVGFDLAGTKIMVQLKHPMWGTLYVDSYVLLERLEGRT